MTGHAGQVRAVVTGAGSPEIKWLLNPPTTSRRELSMRDARHAALDSPIFSVPIYREEYNTCCNGASGEDLEIKSAVGADKNKKIEKGPRGKNREIKK